MEYDLELCSFPKPTRSKCIRKKIQCFPPCVVLDAYVPLWIFVDIAKEWTVNK